MTLTHRKKRPIDQAVPVHRDASLIIIATEGEKTEEQYFRIFRSKKVQVKILSTKEGCSSPEHVLERLREIRTEYDLDKQDQLWVMIDVDRWRPATLSEVAQKATQADYRMAVSNPCFELWLYLHHSDASFKLPPNSKGMVDDLRSILGSYNKSNLDVERFKPHVSEAIRRAKSMDQNPEERWPSSMGTHVYKVVEEIHRLIVP